MKDFKHLVLVFQSDADAIIRDCVNAESVFLPASDFDAGRLSWFGVLESVVEEVAKDLCQLNRIAKARGKRCDLYFCPSLPNLMLHRFSDAAQQNVHVHRRDVDGRAPKP